MSSYYDEMSRRVRRARELKGSEAAQVVVRQVKERVRGYLNYLDRRVYQQHRPRFQAFLVEVVAPVLEGPDTDPAGEEFIIQELHSVAHALANRDLRLKGGVRALDNPYYSGHYGYEEGLEYAD